jgi:hypothetical protein
VERAGIHFCSFVLKGFFLYHSTHPFLLCTFRYELFFIKNAKNTSKSLFLPLIPEDREGWEDTGVYRFCKQITTQEQSGSFIATVNDGQRNT